MAKVIELIKESMKEKKMTQTELAKSLGEDVRVINQQLNRQQDLKAERFLEVMEHIGYRVEMVENDGIRKVNPEMADDIANKKSPDGAYYTVTDEGEVVGIYVEDGWADIGRFQTKEECFDWLDSCAE